MAGLKIQIDTTAPVPGPLAADQKNRLQVVAPKLSTFRAIYRLTTRPYAISIAAGANTRTQAATIHHSSSSQKTALLRHVWVGVESVSVAGIFTFDLSKLNGLPSGGTTIVAAALAGVSEPSAGFAGSEATCLLQPTAGTEFSSSTSAGIAGTTEFNLGVTGAVPTTTPPPDLNWRDILNPTGYQPDFNMELPTLRPGVSEGWAIVLDSNAASTVKFFVIVEFTEE